MKRSIDLAVQLGRSCQSPRTGFVHLFLDAPGGDTIPVYENVCFALALIRQKNAEGVSEGKDLLERLFAFQAPSTTLWEGNFPVYLHDYPRCWNSMQPLRIAPLLQGLLRDFSSIFNAEFKERVSEVLCRLIKNIEALRERKGLAPFWERRYQALLGNLPAPIEPMSADGWAGELITANLLKEPHFNLERLIHPELKVYTGPGADEKQDRFEPKRGLLESWMYPDQKRDLHPALFELAALADREETEGICWSGEVAGWQIRQELDWALSYSTASKDEEGKNLLRWLWAGSKGVHSLCIPRFAGSQRVEEREGGVHILFDLPQEFDVSQNDLIEAALFCNLSDETKLFINGKKGTVFGLGDLIEVRTTTLIFRFCFNVVEGSGDFCGQISKSNRPLQTACRGEDLYSAFDWKISLRTLRRAPSSKLSLTCTAARIASS